MLQQHDLDTANNNPPTWQPTTESHLPLLDKLSVDASVEDARLRKPDDSPTPVSWSDIQTMDAVDGAKINDENTDDSSLDTSEQNPLNEFCSIGIQEFPVFINQDLTLQLIQAPTAFRGVEHDETGGVVWGASICLARFLSSALVLDKTVLELGCGMGVPSLVSVKYGARNVIATDMEDKTLQQLDEVATRNNCQDQLDLAKLHWSDSNIENDNEHQPLHNVAADVVLASDVIYHDQMVEPLVQTIDRYLSNDGKAYIALRNTRQGVRRFWQEAMLTAGFVLEQSISCEEYQGGGEENNGASKLPPGFQNDAHSHRWRGDHTIYIFKRKYNGKASHF